MALNSSCSKAIVDILITHHVSKCAALHVFNTPNFSLPSNDKKGCNFGFPKLVQNKCLVQLHAVPSKTMVDWNNLMLQPQNQEQSKKQKTINVEFQLHRICNFGEQFLIVGNDPLFGSWNPANAIPMTWSEGHVWNVEMGVPAGKFQFKLILKTREGEIVWQPGPNRIVHTWEAMDKITICEDWENDQLQKVTTTNDEVQKTTEEDQLAHPNKELKVESEMTNSAMNLSHHKEKTKSNATKVTKRTC